MRNILYYAAALALLSLPGLAGSQTAAKKKATTAHKTTSTHKKTASTAHKPTAHKTGTASRTARTASTRRKSSRRPVARTTWRNRQMSPTSDRYKEIQDALVAKGYLSADDATGAWGQSSADALKKFQADQSIAGDGKLNSLSLIALGLGPKYDSTSAPKPQDAHPQEVR